MQRVSLITKPHAIYCIVSHLGQPLSYVVCTDQQYCSKALYVCVWAFGNFCSAIYILFSTNRTSSRLRLNRAQVVTCNSHFSFTSGDSKHFTSTDILCGACRSLPMQLSECCKHLMEIGAQQVFVATFHFLACSIFSILGKLAADLENE